MELSFQPSRFTAEQREVGQTDQTGLCRGPRRGGRERLEGVSGKGIANTIAYGKLDTHVHTDT